MAERPPSASARPTARATPSAEKGGTRTSGRGAPLVVGVGAAASSPDGLFALFRAMPDKPGMSFVVVQQGESRDDAVVGALAACALSPIADAADATAVEPNRIYLAKPGTSLIIEGGVLRLVKPKRARDSRTRVDRFLSSLAADAGERAIGIVLSGGGTYGAAGLRDIKEHGGLTIVEEPFEAGAIGIAQSPFASTHVDMILPASRMPEKLVSYARHAYLCGAPADQPVGGLRLERDDELLPITELLRHETTHDFRRYRRNTLWRRIQRRMGLNQVDAIPDYLELLREDRREVQALRRDLLICVTRFFRDPEAWGVLTQRVLRELVDDSDRGTPIRAWVPGCATGEEAYTLGILLNEQLDQAGVERRVQIFATDIADDALDVARAGVFPPAITADLGDDRLRTFFTREGDKYRVTKRLRESVVFAEQNVLAQPPFSRLDLICCRNLLIYLEPDAQQRVMDVFQYALLEGGYLFLGTSETVGAAKPLFSPVSKKWRIFRRTGVSAAPPLELLGSLRPPLQRARQFAVPVRPEGRKRGIAERVQRQLLKELERGIAVVDAQNRLLYLHGMADLYLQLSVGDVSADYPDVLTLAREGLRSKLRAAVRQARQTGERVTAECRVLRDGRYRRCRATVRPLDGDDEGTLLISFEPARDVPAERREDAGAELVDAESSIVQELQHELATTREQLNATIEDLETANDALKVSSEEAIAMNEELQSGNEELETSKEELQSLNEELTTLNHQLEAKVAELQSTTNDLDNLLTSSHVPTIFLDVDWCISRFTPSCEELFNLIPSDVGRPLTDIASAVLDPCLFDDARAVLADLQPRERQVQTRAHDRHYKRRILPYRTGDDRIEGVVLTFADVTDLQQASEKLIRRERQQKALARLGQRALDEKDVATLMDAAVETVRQTFEAEFVKVLELLPDGQRLLVRAGVGWREGVVGHTIIDKDGDSQAAYALCSNEAVVVHNLVEDPRFDSPALLFEHGAVSGISAIIHGRTSPIGVLGVHTKHEARFTIDDIDFVESVAHILAAAIERMRSEQAVHEAEERLRLATQANDLGTWDYDPQADIIVACPRSKQLFGMARNAVVRYDTFLERVHPQDRRRVDLSIRRSLDPRGTGHCDMEYRSAPDGSGASRWIRDTRQTFFTDGRAVRMIGTLEDVTARKEAEEADAERLQLAERLQRIAEAAPGTIFTFRIDGSGGPPAFPFTTARVRDTYGLEPEDLATDAMPLFARIQPEDAQKLQAVTRESAEKMSMWHSQFRYDHPWKGEVWIESYASPVREADGALIWHGIAHDITELKHAEMELLEARRIAEAADRAKGEFLANMSHEIRTPMSAILGYTEILSNQLRNPDNLQSLNTIRSNGLYLLEIIDDILDLSRIEAGKLELDRQRVRPDVVLRDVQSLLKLHAAEKGLALDVEFEGTLPETIETDPTRLRQILINLIENAIKFTDAGAVRVVARLLPQEARLRFDVIDSGIGIPDETLNKLFHPFTQADSSVTRRFGGSGLGLSICRALAKMLGGDVTVTTKVGEGSTFTLTIGTGELAGVALFDPEKSAETRIPWSEDIRALDCHVLVVDDRRDMRYLAQHMLEEAGARVALAVDGEDALARVADAAERGRPFDAILLDMQMPVLDGYAAAEKLRQCGYDRAIIALTANAMRQDERKCLESGCDDYLSKPLARATLVNTVAYYTNEVSPDELLARRAAYRAAPVVRAEGVAEAWSAADGAPENWGAADAAAWGAATASGEAQAARSRSAAGAQPGADRRSIRRSVLVVDDNDDSSMMLKILLEACGCEVVVAASGEAAIAAADAALPDVAVIDLGLPGMSGDELVVELRSRPALGKCRYICLSGRSPTEVDWQRAGFDHFVQKPARFDEIKKLIGGEAAL